jgi:hypothetical protein
VPQLFDWSPNDKPGRVTDVTSEDGWAYIRDFYAPPDPTRGRGGRERNPALERIIQIAQEHAVKSVLIERRYIDMDYRSEHSHFYSTTFRRYPSVSHRLHFFASVLPKDLTNLPGCAGGYRGYSVMRPLPSSPVGRTMIAPPPELADAPRCSGKDTVHIFGWPFQVEAMPFVSQDAQYLRCAHAALWMVLYHSYLNGISPRILPHDIHEAAMGGDVVGRQVPSEGLSVPQMLNALHNFGLSSGHLRLPANRDVSREADRLSLFGILCRYVNSQMPPVVHSANHVWVISAYRRSAPGLGHDKIVLYRHDDARGPYLRVDDPWAELEGEPGPWVGVFPPLPEKFYLTAERAELLGRMAIRRRARTIGSANPVLDAMDQSDLTFRTYALQAHVFKSSSDARMPGDLAKLYRFANWPRFIWIVEAVHRPSRDDGKPDVLGEVIIDPTADHLSMRADNTVLGVHLAGHAFIVTPDFGRRLEVRIPHFSAYMTGCPVGASSPA